MWRLMLLVGVGCLLIGSLVLTVARWQDAQTSYLMAFTSTEGGGMDIFTVRSDGEQRQRVTSFLGTDRNPRFSPDGMWLLYTRTERGNTDLYKIRLGTDQPQRLTSHPRIDDEGVWSPDGTRIAFFSRRDGDTNLYVMDADGQNIQQLTALPDQKSHLQWTGDWLTFTQFSESYFAAVRVHVITGEIIEIVSDSTLRYAPAVSPDGQWVALGGNDAQDDAQIFIEGQRHITLINLRNPTDVRRIDTPGEDIFPYWSPDGSLLAFETHYRERGCEEECQRSAEINLYEVATGELSQLPRTNFLSTPPHLAWSPDGQRIAFIDFDFGTRSTDIDIVTRDTQSIQPFVSSLGEDWQAVWSPPIDYGWRVHRLLFLAIAVMILTFIIHRRVA